MSNYLFIFIIMEFWPQKVEIKEVGINSLWALISWVVGSIIMLGLIFLLSGFINISDWFSSARSWVWQKTSIFPMILSVITFLSTSITLFLTNYFLHLSNPERYKKNNIILGQIAFFTFFIYLFVAPIYIYSWMIDYDYIMIVFLIHTILVVFWVSLITEILNNYRYVLVSVYGSFLWLFASIIITWLIFWSLETGSAKLISLLFLLPIINFMQVFFKWIFDLWYYHYNLLTGKDQIWDIFSQIETEEKQALREEEEKNSI